MSATANSGVAILGSGIVAKQGHLPALKALGPLAPTLKAIYSRSEKSARALAELATQLLPSNPDIYHDDDDPTNNLDALLSRSDVSTVLVALPITVQPSIILKALAAGKHVLSEKPVAPDIALGLELIATYEREYKPKGLIWRVSEKSEAEPGYTTAAQAIRAGKIGRVTHFILRDISRVEKESIQSPWRKVPEHQGGFLLDSGAHSAAALRVVLPSPMTHLSGLASLNADWLAPHDTLHALIQSADGSHGILELSFAAPTDSRTSIGNGLVVTGTSGYLAVDRVETTDPVSGEDRSVYRITIKSVADGNTGLEREGVIDEPERGIELELASFFAAALEGKEDGLGSLRGALRDVAIIEAGLKSGGRLMDLNKLIGQVS